jgi:serine phosphatase RsbU (regulator of sigma subunit)
VFGSDRLRAVLRENRAGGASALVGGVIEALRSFARQAEPHDDVTMLAATFADR